MHTYARHPPRINSKKNFMSPIDFLFALFAGRFTLSVDEFNDLKERINNDLQNSSNRFASFLRSPYLLLLLPIILPFVKSWLDRLAAKWIPDTDNDDDHDIQDLLAALSEKLTTRKNIQ